MEQGLTQVAELLNSELKRHGSPAQDVCRLWCLDQAGKPLVLEMPRHIAQKILANLAVLLK